MSNDVAIRVSGLGKEYVLGGAENAEQSFREMLLGSLKAPFKRLKKLRGDVVEEQRFWALKDVNFEVHRGEVVGIIGRNGAGKSTLLKILSRITDPTEGRIEIKGRISSLLEVGTGFHPELTGRENIFLNGAILGMSRKEITRKFDEIVAFSEVEKFLDTPVKRYSSGMYVRLAFAVAAHLEPEILIVDEVLAVGDAAFQKKCLGKMGDVATEGRTVIFVSHNMSAVKSLCSRVVLLNEGRLNKDGEVNEVVREYSRLNSVGGELTTRDIGNLVRTKGSGQVKINKISLFDLNGEPTRSFSVWEPFKIEVEVMANSFFGAASFWILISSEDGNNILSSFQYDSQEPASLPSEQTLVTIEIGSIELVPGDYIITVGCFGKMNEFLDWVDGAITFEVRAEMASGKVFDGRLGYIAGRHVWALKGIL